MVIGISGTNGSGKDTIGHLLAERHNYEFVSASDMLRDELRVRGVPLERDNLRNLSAEWRRQHGNGVLVLKAKEVADRAGKSLAVASLRNPGEAEEVKRLGGIVVWVDADPEVRYTRISNARRNRIDDDKTFDEFLAEEQAEMNHQGDSATLNMSGVRDLADLVIINNSSDIEVFKDEAEKKLASYL